MARLKEEKDINFVNYDLLKKETKRLEGDKKKLISEINTETAKLSGLIEKGIQAEKEAERIIAEAKEQAKVIVSKAKQKDEKSNALQADLQGKLSEAEKAKKEADNLIKSNQGREKGLAKEREEAKEIKAKLSNILQMVKDI